MKQERETGWLSFSPKLPTSVLLSIVGQLEKKAGERAACVKREWRDVMRTAKALGMYRATVLPVATGGDNGSGFTLCVTANGVFSSSVSGEDEFTPELGHGEDSRTELVPRIIEALAGKKVVGAAVGGVHAVWTNAGELFTTVGCEGNGRLGHGGQENQYVPRRAEALGGKKVVGASAGDGHTAMWTEAGELFSFGYGNLGQLVGQQNEFVPRLVEPLAGKKVVGNAVAWTDAEKIFTFENGSRKEIRYVPRLIEALAGKKVIISAAACECHTAVWTESGELFTFGTGVLGSLGHGGKEEESVPWLVEALAGKKVIGTAAGSHTGVWTDAGELFTFGRGTFARAGRSHA